MNQGDWQVVIFLVVVSFIVNLLLGFLKRSTRRQNEQEPTDQPDRPASPQSALSIENMRAAAGPEENAQSARTLEQVTIPTLPRAQKLDIITHPNPILTTPSVTVTRDEFRSGQFTVFIDSLIKTMRKNAGLGLAAVQVGVNKKVFVVREPGLMGTVHIFVNARLQSTNGPLRRSMESCLSIPVGTFTVQRYNEISVEALWKREGGKWYHAARRFRGAMARRIQHELDHADGIMINVQG